MPTMFFATAAKLAILRAVRAQHHSYNIPQHFSPGQLFYIAVQKRARPGRKGVPSLRRRLSRPHQILRPLRWITRLINES